MNNKINEYVEVLSLFNEKADEIKNSSYAKFVLEKKPKTTISKNRGEAIKIKTIEPNDESLKSFVLTLRLFLQNNDQISFQNISKIYEKLPNNFQKEKKSFSQARKKINDILNININIKYNNRTPTYYEVLDTFIYGDLAHIKIDKRNTYKDWKSRKETGLFDIFKISFHSIAINLIQCILYMKKLNAEVIRKVNK
jgi:uncharacterized protein YlaN (UPF0358 family)